MITRRHFVAGAGALFVASACGGAGDGSATSPTTESTRRPGTRKGLVSAWSVDRFSMGAYSFMKKGATPADREALAEPMGDRVFFAGEATDADYPATVHGAINSGWRAADELMEEIDDDVIVIGAGAAGLAAASYLVEEDYDVVVLEGRDRIGGRMWTDTKTFGVPVDLGCSWIHGVDGNPVSDFDVETAPFDYDDYAVKGRSTDDFEIASEIEMEFAADADQLSPWAEEEGEEDLPGGDHLVVGGYQRVADELAEDVDVELGVEVTEIRWAGPGVDVVTTEGTRHAQGVIVTVPLGVLQAGRPKFSPGLPAAKAAAIRRLGMGAMSKAILQFDEVFWDDVAMIGLPGRTPRTQWTEFVNLEPFTGKPLIMGFCCGRAARDMEKLPADQVLASAEAALRSVYR